MKRLAFLFLLLLTAGSPLLFGAGDYTIEELVDENATTSPPFSISHVVPFPDGLRFFLTTDSPDAVADLLADGALQAELSDHESETATAVSLSLGSHLVQPGRRPVLPRLPGRPACPVWRAAREDRVLPRGGCCPRPGSRSRYRPGSRLLVA